MSEELKNEKEAGIKVFRVLNALLPIVDETNMSLLSSLMADALTAFNMREIGEGIQLDLEKAEHLSKLHSELHDSLHEDTTETFHQLEIYGEVLAACNHALTAAISVLRGEKNYFNHIAETQSAIQDVCVSAMKSAVIWQCEYTLRKHSELLWQRVGDHYLCDFETPDGEHLRLLVDSTALSNAWKFGVYGPHSGKPCVRVQQSRVTDMECIANKSGFKNSQEARLACELFLDAKFPKEKKDADGSAEETASEA